jgi:hypothetical protein
MKTIVFVLAFLVLAILLELGTLHRRINQLAERQDRLEEDQET